MRVEISDGKIKGWLKASEAADIMNMSRDNFRMKVKRKQLFPEKDVMRLYGNMFIRQSAVEKLAKKLGLLEKE